MDLLLPSGRISLVVRDSHLEVAQGRPLGSIGELTRYREAVERAAVKDRRDRILIRGPVLSAERSEVHDALWAWWQGSVAIAKTAIITTDGLVLTHINMLALSKRTRVRAFSDEEAAMRWLVLPVAGPSTMDRVELARASTPPQPIDRRSVLPSIPAGPSVSTGLRVRPSITELETPATGTQAPHKRR